MSDLSIAVLLSAGRHPISGRGRRASLDARALGLAFAVPDARVQGLHAGDPDDPALRDYLGQGLDKVTVLAVAPGHDVLAPLLAHLLDMAPDIILAGELAEAGEASGMLPYLLAESLGRPLVPQLAALTIDGREAEVLQGLPRGQRRRLRVSLPFLGLIGPAAAAPRQFAFARAGRGEIESITVSASPDSAAATWTFGPAQPRPKRLAVGMGGNAAERLAAVTGAGSKVGQILAGLDPDQAAEALYNALVEEEVL